MYITILTTPETIEKTYNERDGSLRNYHTILPKMLDTFCLPDLEVMVEQVVFKDSLEMTEYDRRHILRAAQKALPVSDAIIILHGTDTMAETGELLNRELTNLQIPVILTGAIQPYKFRDTDALQNVTESLLTARLVSPGVYVVMHNRVLTFPGVVKDCERLTFLKP